MKIYLWIFLIVLCFPLIHAESSIKITSDIQSSTYIDYIIKIEPENRICNLSFEIPSDSVIVYLTDEYGNMDYNLNQNIIHILFKECILEGDKTILLKLKTKSVITAKIGYDEYVTDFSFNGVLKDADIKHVVKLREGINESDITNILPKGYKQTSYDNRIVIEWNTKANSIFIIRYKTSSFDYMIIIYILAGIIFLTAIVYVVYYLIRNYKKSLIFKKISYLNEKEKNVLELIIKSPGINQNLIVQSLNLTKSNLSKIMAKLEFRGLAKKKDFGKINKWYPGDKL